MNHPITLVLVLDAHIQVRPYPTFCSAEQVVPTTSCLDLAAAVLARVFNVQSMCALAGCVTCASWCGSLAGLVFPERLVGAKLRIDRLSSGSCSLELLAGVGGRNSAPVKHLEAVVGFRTAS